MGKNMRGNGNIWVLILLLLVGGLCGGALGNALAPVLPWLNATSQVGLKPSTLDLHFLNITFGFTFALGPLTALGMILGYIVYRRL